MKIIDLTHLISEDMPVYPGTEPPKLQQANTIENDGFQETLLTMYSHTGTHMDAPAHVVAGKPTLDQLPVSQFAGKALVIDCTDVQPGQRVGLDHLTRVQAKVEQAEFILFNMGWAQHWGTDEFFGDYPCITEEVAQYLIDQHKKGIGLDTISVDPIGHDPLKIHRQLFTQRDMVVIENLANLHQVGDQVFTFCALPLKYRSADGAPIRAIAILED